MPRNIIDIVNELSVRDAEDPNSNLALEFYNRIREIIDDGDYNDDNEAEESAAAIVGKKSQE